eukprot:5426803-Prymnesium_polylepis.4
MVQTPACESVLEAACEPIWCSQRSRCGRVCARKPLPRSPTGRCSVWRQQQSGVGFEALAACGDGAAMVWLQQRCRRGMVPQWWRAGSCSTGSARTPTEMIVHGGVRCDSPHAALASSPRPYISRSWHAGPTGPSASNLDCTEVRVSAASLARYSSVLANALRRIVADMLRSHAMRWCTRECRSACAPPCCSARYKVANLHDCACLFLDTGVV